MPISRAPPPAAKLGIPIKPRSIWFVEGVDAIAVGLSPGFPEPLVTFENASNASRIMGCSLGHVGFIRGNCVARPDRNATESGNGLAIKLFDAEQDVCLVHRLKIEIGAE